MRGVLTRVFWGVGGQEIPRRLRENNFDELRLAFATIVVFFHAAVLSEVPSFHWMQYAFSGALAVQCFFFVSGFLVTMSCERSSSLISYFKKRALRIAPAYVFVVVGAAVLLSLLSALSAAEYFKDPGFRTYVLRNLLLANFAAPTLPGVFAGNPAAAVNGSLWTIKIEVGFYCIVPVLLWASRRFGGMKISGIVFLLSLTWFVGFTLAARHTGIDFFDKLAKQVPGQLSFFMGGAWAYYRTRDGAPPPAFGAALLAGLAYGFTGGLFHQVIAPVAVTLMVYWLAIALPVVGRLGRYGDFSYGTYLYHFPVIQVFVALGYFRANPLLALVGVCAVVFGMAILSWNFLEKRFLRHKSRPRADTAAGEW